MNSRVRFVLELAGLAGLGAFVILWALFLLCRDVLTFVDAVVLGGISAVLTVCIGMVGTSENLLDFDQGKISEGHRVRATLLADRIGALDDAGLDGADRTPPDSETTDVRRILGDEDVASSGRDPAS